MSTKGQSQQEIKKKRTTRQSILFWVFTLSAIPLTVLVVIIAGGYHFDSDTRSLVPSSAIMIETTPKEVVIELGNEAIDTKTPFIRKLEPGNYTVGIRQDRYHSWEKDLVFTETKSLIFPSIVLFPDTVPLKSDDQEAREAPSEGLKPIAEDLLTIYQEAGWEDPTTLQYLDGPVDLVVDSQQSSAYLLKKISTFTDDDRIDAQISDAEWNDERILLYVSGTELWIYDHRSEQHTLLQRQSKPIVDATWHPNGGYILFSDSDGLFAIELDERDYRQTWHLSTLPETTELTINSKADAITFQSKGVYYEQALEY